MKKIINIVVVNKKKKKKQSRVRAVITQESHLLKYNAGPKAMLGTFGKDPAGNEVLYNVARVQRLLHSRLRKIMPLAYQDSTSHSDKEETNE